MKKLLLTLLCILSLSSWHANAQLTCENTFTQSGTDAGPTVLTINASDLDCNGAQSIISLKLTNAAGNLTNFYCSTSGGGWYSFDLNVDGVVTSDVCASQINDVDISGFTTLSIVSKDNDNWTDSVTITIDVEVTYTTPSCVNPTALAASGETTTTVDLDWTAGDSETLWDIELVDVTASGSATGTPTTEDVTTNPYTLTGLTAENDYQVYLRADCGAGDTSDWVGPVTFTTLCNAYTIPYTEGFETGYTNGSAVGGCLTQESTIGTPVWTANSTTTSYNRSPRTGSWNAYLSYSNTDWMFIAVSLTGGQSYDFEMYARQDGSGSTNSNITVSYGDAAAAASMTNSIVAETGIINGDYQQIAGSFTPSATATYYIGVKGYMNGSPWYISIDDISIEETPSCVNPAALAASGETATTVDLDWTAGDSETLWDIELVDVTASGSATGTPTTEDISTNPYTLTGLTAQNDYQVYLRADCGGGDTSDWVGPVSFTTLCNATTTPYTEDFETFTTSTAAFTNENCWSSSGGSYFWEMAAGTDTSSSSTGPNPSITTGNYFFTEASAGSTGSTTSLTTFIDLSSLTVPLLSFDYHMYGSNMGSLDVIINSDTVLTLTGQQQTSDASPFITADVDLSSYAGQSVTVTFRGTRGAGYAGDIAIDNVSFVETPSCLDVTGVAVGNVVADTAEVSWTDSNPTPAGLYQYELVDVTGGDVVLTTDTTTASPLTLTGLTTLNEYKIRVRANCGSVLSASYSAWSSYVSWTQVELPGCPTNVTPIDGATDQSWQSITLSWDAPTTGGAATSYSVLYGTTEAGMFEVGTTTNTTYTLNGLNPGATVFIGVNAVNAGGTSASCTANSITTNTDGLGCATPVEVFEGTNTQDILAFGYNYAFYTYTATTAGSLTIDSCGQGVDTYLQTLDDGCTALTGTYDDGCSSGYGSTFTVDVLPNDVINFRFVWYWTGSNVDHDFNVTLTPTCSGTTTTWDGTAWSNGAPDANSYAIISGAYSTGTDGDVTACVMQVDASVTIDGTTDAAISEVLVMAGNTLTIDETSSLTVSGDFTNTGTVTLNSTADDYSSLIVTGTASGDIVYNRYVNVYDDTLGGGWDLVCSPVGMSIADFITANGSNIQVLDDDYAFSQFNNATGQWERYATASQTGNFEAGKGYSMATTGGSTVAFTGAMQTADQSINIINNNGLNGVGRRWNLVSNPFPSYILGNTAAGTNNFMDANSAVIDSEFLAVYGWNGSSYTIYNNLSGAFSMAPGQGFWVAALNTTDTALNFTAAMRTTTGTGDFVSGPQLLTYNVAVKLYNGEIEKAATDFYFRDGLSLDLDPGYDAAAFNQSMALSTRLPQGSQETAFGINAMGMDAMQNTRVPLEIRQNAGQAFRVSIADMELPEDIYVYLEDTLNGTLTSLKDGDFELVAQSNLSGSDRFFIVFKSNSVLSNGDTLGINALNVYKANTDSFVTIAGISPELGKLNVSLYNILGQTVREKALSSATATQTISTDGLASGLYIVQIRSGNQTTVKKIIIK